MTTSGASAMDQAKLEAFGGKIVGLGADAFLSLLISIGHQTELFDKLAGMSPSTSAEIARQTRLNERYVREWLNAMTTGGIVEYDTTKQTYRLPPEHAAFLTRAAGPNNFAGFMQYVALCGLIEKPLIEAFRKGGGVPYSAYPDFQRLQAAESTALFDTLLVQAILPMAAGLSDRLTSGIDALDVGTGQGHAVNVLAKAFPKSRFTGMDFAEEGVSAGRSEAATWGLKNAKFQTADVAASIPGKYDLITAFDMVHDLAKPRQVLKNIAGALKPGGTFLMMDIAGASKVEENIGNPLAPLIYSISVLHCMTVSLSQGGEGLGTAWGEQKAQEYMKDAGFKSIDVKRLPDDPFHVFYVCKLK